VLRWNAHGTFDKAQAEETTQKVKMSQTGRTNLAKAALIRQSARRRRFLSTQADRFAGAKREEKASACTVRNDVHGERGGMKRKKRSAAPPALG